MQGLKDLMLNANSEIRADLTTLNVTVCSMHSELHILKEQMRPLLKKKKVDNCGVGTCRRL